ncbi:hypothetical protein AMTRI_Chr05g64620 [Amborella trichopoda]
MDDTEDDARYPPNPYPFNFQSSSSFPSSHRPKLPLRNPSLSTPNGHAHGHRSLHSRHNQQLHQEEEEYEEEEEEEGEGEGEGEDEEEEDLERETAEEDEDDEQEGEEDHNEEKEEEGDEEREAEEREEHEEEDEGDEVEREKAQPHHPIKEEEEEDHQPEKRQRRHAPPAQRFEFAARASRPSSGKPQQLSVSSPFGRASQADWCEHSTMVLLEAWGERFLQHGRKSLRSDEWAEVSKRVSASSETPRTEAQCRNRLDTLKKKFKREKQRIAEAKALGHTSSSKWPYFKKMDRLMSQVSSATPQASPQAPARLACGLDSGEFVFGNPRICLNPPGDSPESSDSGSGDSPPPLPKRARVSDWGSDGGSFRLLADSIQRFGEIYEKIENSKRQQMMELERMRMDFQRELELQKRHIMERAQAEIAKMREEEEEEEEDEDEEIDVSVTNVSG